VSSSRAEPKRVIAQGIQPKRIVTGEWQVEYYNYPPQIFLKFSGPQDSGKKRYLSLKRFAEIHFHYLKNSAQIGSKVFLSV